MRAGRLVTVLVCFATLVGCSSGTASPEAGTEQTDAADSTAADSTAADSTAADSTAADSTATDSTAAASTTAAADPTTTAPPAPADPTTKTCTVPNVVGMVHQDAQDTMQAAGLYILREEDATGQGRMLVVDRNWVTTKQSEPAGSEVDCLTEILLHAKKAGE